MKLIITNLPAFYKIELYNRVNRLCPLTVVFTGADSKSRNMDFYNGNMEFNHIVLHGTTLSKLLQIIKLVCSSTFKEVVIGGWDSMYYWVAAVFSPKKKNAVIVESSDFESSTEGIMGVVKRLFFTRISKAYCSGTPHKRLVQKLGLKGKSIITKGVGIFKYHQQPKYQARQTVKDFLYVGRLVEVKNLQYLIQRFNDHPELNLHIIGFGEQEEVLKKLAKGNVKFYGAVDNAELAAYYQKFDVFILPSKSEPWGLVVEEALNNGMPVMVSNHVGCHEDLVNDLTGVVFSLQDEDFEDRLKEVCNIQHYNQMRQHISTLDFEEVERKQTLCYI